jgi:hypothetical protein
LLFAFIFATLPFQYFIFIIIATLIRRFHFIIFSYYFLSNIFIFIIHFQIDCHAINITPSFQPLFRCQQYFACLSPRLLSPHAADASAPPAPLLMLPLLLLRYDIDIAITAYLPPALMLIRFRCLMPAISFDAFTAIFAASYASSPPLLSPLPHFAVFASL